MAVRTLVSSRKRKPSRAALSRASRLEERSCGPSTEPQDALLAVSVLAVSGLPRGRRGSGPSRHHNQTRQLPEGEGDVVPRHLPLKREGCAADPGVCTRALLFRRGTSLSSCPECLPVMSHHPGPPQGLHLSEGGPVSRQPAPPWVRALGRPIRSDWPTG